MLWCTSPLLADTVEKSLLADEQNSSGPLVRPTCADARDHIDSHESDHKPSYPFHGAVQRQTYLKTNLREYFGAVRFSTFSTVSAQGGHSKARALAWLGRRRSKDPFAAGHTARCGIGQSSVQSSLIVQRRHSKTYVMEDPCHRSSSPRAAAPPP